MEQKKNNDQRGKELNEKAYEYFLKAEQLSKQENRLLAKNRANRATVAAELGKFSEAEEIFLELIHNDPGHLLYYYNIACTYSRLG
jgi:tetratricopeptide (TPR) repeat protein